LVVITGVMNFLEMIDLLCLNASWRSIHTAQQFSPCQDKSNLANGPFNRRNWFLL